MVQLCHTMEQYLKFQVVLKGPIGKNPALVKIMAWCRTGDKLLSEQMLTRFTDAYMRHQTEVSYVHYVIQCPIIVCLSYHYNSLYSISPLIGCFIKPQ